MPNRDIINRQLNNSIMKSFSETFNSPERRELNSILKHLDQLDSRLRTASVHTRDYQGLLSRTLRQPAVDPAELVDEVARKETMCAECVEVASNVWTRVEFLAERNRSLEEAVAECSEAKSELEQRNRELSAELHSLQVRAA